MRKSPKEPITTHDRDIENGQPTTCQLDSADIRSRIATADVVVAVDQFHEIRTVFHGREILEEIVQSGVARGATVLIVVVDFVSDEPERLESLVRDLKGRSSFQPADIFPKIEIDTSSFSTTHELLPAVRLAVDELRNQHRTLLPLMQRRFYYLVRARGFMAAHAALREGMKLAREQGSNETSQAYAVCLATLGELLYKKLPTEFTKQPPTWCVDVVHRFGNQDRKLAVRCRSLQVRKTSKGPAYFSRRMPRMGFQGIEGKWLVAFSFHALKRICERTVYDWRTYSGHGDAFAFLENCVYFEDCTAIRGEPSFVVYNSCVPGFASWNYVRQVLGNPVPGRQYYYRVGYCPVSFDGDVAKAITLLVPGMSEQKGTPEANLIAKTGLPSAEVARLHAQVECQMSMKELEDSGDYSLIKWFHENGVPQVVPFEHDVFRYDCETPQGWQEIGDGGRVIDLGF